MRGDVAQRQRGPAAAELKAKKKAGIPHDTLRGKNVALIFEENFYPHPLLL